MSAYVSVAANAARAKYISDCKFIMEHGESVASNTISEKQAYAECVSVIYPPEHSSDPTMKIFVACMLVAAVIGAVVGFFKANDWDIEEKIMLPLFGGIIGVAAVMVGAIALLGIQYVFS